MSHGHHHGQLTDWVAAGAGFMLGMLLFKLLVIIAALAFLGFWRWTESIKPPMLRNPTDPKNLWPEPYYPSLPDGGAHAKHRVESHFHREVCSGRINLQEAQSQIANDWYRVYVQMPGR